MGLVPSPWFYENRHKVNQVFLMLKLPYTKSGTDIKPPPIYGLPLTHDPWATLDDWKNVACPARLQKKWPLHF